MDVGEVACINERVQSLRVFLGIEKVHKRKHLKGLKL
jgi:hypothetical protein